MGPMPLTDEGQANPPVLGQPARQRPHPTPDPPPPTQRGAGRTATGGSWGWLIILLPMLACCGGPVLLGVLATASAATLGLAGAVIGGILVAVAVGWWLHRRHGRAGACCPPAEPGGRW